jgi:hypothetical protein
MVASSPARVESRAMSERLCRILQCDQPLQVAPIVGLEA